MAALAGLSQVLHGRDEHNANSVKQAIVTDFIELDTSGELTVKKAYAWDGDELEHEFTVDFLAAIRRQYALGEDHPNVALSYSGLGKVATSQGRYEEAIECNDRALELPFEV